MAGWRWYCVQEPAAAVARLDDFLALMRQSDPEKDAYMTPEREAFFRRIAQCTAELDLLRLFFLEMDGQDVATSLCFDYNGAVSCTIAGIIPSTPTTALACCSTPCACARH